MSDTIHRFDTIDLDLLKFDGDPCPVRQCDLGEGHDGSHIEVNPYSGLVYYTWEAEPSFVSDKALQVAHQINSIRDAITEAIEEAEGYYHLVRAENINLKREDDPALYAILHDRDVWPHENPTWDSGFESRLDGDLRAELVDLYELDGLDELRGQR